MGSDDSYAPSNHLLSVAFRAIKVVVILGTLYILLFMLKSYFFVYLINYEHAFVIMSILQIPLQYASVLCNESSLQSLHITE